MVVGWWCVCVWDGLGTDHNGMVAGQWVALDNDVAYGWCRVLVSCQVVTWPQSAHHGLQHQTGMNSFADDSVQATGCGEWVVGSALDVPVLAQIAHLLIIGGGMLVVVMFGMVLHMCSHPGWP